MGRLQIILIVKIASFANPLQKTVTPCTNAKEIHWVAGADARNGFPHLKYEIWPRNELDIVVSKSVKSADYGHGSLVCGLWFVVGRRRPWRECSYVRTWYILHTFIFVPGLQYPFLS
jgi:hypothetical protein